MEYIKYGEEVIVKTDNGEKIILHFSESNNEQTEELIINNLMSSYEARYEMKDI